MAQEDARVNDLVENNLRLVSYVIKKYYSTHIGDDDAFQFGSIGLMRAAKTYDVSRGSFSTYAVYFIRGAIKNSIRDKYAKKRKGDLEVSSLDFVASEESERSITLHEICGQKSFEEQYINSQMIHELLATTELKDEERACLELYYFQGFNQVEINEIFHFGNVSRKINTALNKLRLNAFQYVS